MTEIIIIIIKSSFKTGSHTGMHHTPSFALPYAGFLSVVYLPTSKIIELYWSKLISILFKILDVIYVQITNISLASRLSCRSRSLTAVTSHWLASEIRHTLSSVIILYMHLNGTSTQT